MLSPKDVFHDIVRDQGGRVDEASLPSSVGQGLAYVAHRARGFLASAAEANSQIPAIHFDLVDNYSLNAFATRWEDQYFIGINRGTVAILALVFDRLLADRSVLPYFGQVEREAESLPLMPALGPNFFRSVTGVDFFQPPRDPSRRAISQRLTEMALDFIVAHEFAHIANGHVDFLHGTYGIGRIEEVCAHASEDPKGNGTLHRKTLEMNADEVATVFTLVNEWKRCLHRLPRRGPVWDDIYDHPGMVTMLWSYAIAVLCRIFGDMRLQRGTAVASDYPTWRLRSVMIQQATGKIQRPADWMRSGIMPNEDVGHSIPLVALASFKGVEADFAAVTGLPISRAGLDDAWSNLGQSEIEEMECAWTREIRPSLESMAFQPLELLSMSFFG